jgi:hypothetical protein
MHVYIAYTCSSNSALKIDTSRRVEANDNSLRGSVTYISRCYIIKRSVINSLKTVLALDFYSLPSVLQTESAQHTMLEVFHYLSDIMRLPTLLALFLVPLHAPLSFATPPSRNSLECEVAPGSELCNPQLCVAYCARCQPNEQGTGCVQGVTEFSWPRIWWSWDATRDVCQGCYCQSQPRLTKAAILAFEIRDGICLMTSRDSKNICDGARCFEDGIRCLAVKGDKCWPYLRKNARARYWISTSWASSTTPETCRGCRCMRVQ